MIDTTNPENVSFDYAAHSTPATVMRIHPLPGTNLLQVMFAELVREPDGRVIAKGTVRLLVTPEHMAAFGGSMLKIGSSMIEKPAAPDVEDQPENKG